MVDRWNWLMHKPAFPWAPRGFLDWLALDKLVVVPDGALPLAGGLSGNNPDSRDRTVDVMWGYPWDPNAVNPGEFYGFRWNGPFYIDFGSIHEMNHARYNVDLYALDENHNASSQNVQLTDDFGSPVPGSSYMPFIAWDVVYYNKWRDIMGAGAPVFDGYSVGAWNWKHHRRGRGNQNAPPDLGAFLNDLPLSNHVQFVDQNGVPLAGADVYLYRATGNFYSKLFDDVPDGTFSTDPAGMIHLGRNPFGTTSTFGGSCPDIILKVRYRGQLYFLFQEVTDFNIQNWLNAGAQKQAADGYCIREIDLRDNPTTVPPNAWLGNYFNGTTFDSFAAQRTEGNSNGLVFSCPDGSPIPGVDSTNYSVYWQGRVPFTEGWKNFTITVDGGFRLWIDGRLLVDQWTNSLLQTWSPVLYTSASSPFVNPGQSTPNGSLHRVEVRYRHISGPASLNLAWADQPPPSDVPLNAWRADYYSTKNLAGYMLSRTELAINNDYQDGSPDPAIGGDNFSARWTGDWDLPQGTHTFTAITDDGMRIYLDDALVLNQWFDQAPTTYSFSRSLAAGRHRIRVEYYENTVGAVARFSWKSSPLITVQPQDRTALAGSTVQLNVAAVGVPAPAFQWRFSGTNLPGSTSPALVLTNIDQSNAGPYDVLVTNAAGSVSSRTATLKVVPISAQPALSSPALLANGVFQFTLSGDTGWLYRLEASTNLLTWFPLADLPYTNPSVRFTDPQATNFPYRFYRALIP
ncbi:MAG TPA: PA14 domain-containing protein [Verrucomicrobiae bacterium]